MYFLSLKAFVVKKNSANSIFPENEPFFNVISIHSIIDRKKRPVSEYNSNDMEKKERMRKKNAFVTAIGSAFQGQSMCNRDIVGNSLEKTAIMRWNMLSSPIT